MMIQPIAPTTVLMENQTQDPVFQHWWLGLGCRSAATEPIRDVREEMISKARRYVELGPEWLGPGSTEIPDVTADRIVEVAIILRQVDGLPNPKMTPNINGTISLEWESPRGEAYLEYGMYRVNGYVCSPDNPTEYIEGLDALPISFFTYVRDRLFPISEAHSITVSYGIPELMELA